MPNYCAHPFTYFGILVDKPCSPFYLTALGLPQLGCNDNDAIKQVRCGMRPARQVAQLLLPISSIALMLESIKAAKIVQHDKTNFRLARSDFLT